MDDSEIIESYIVEKSVMSWSAQTVRLRRWQLGDWRASLGSRTLNSATRTDVIKWLSRFSDASTRRAAFSAVHCFYRWGRERRLLTADPTLGLDAPPIKRGVPRPIPDSLFWASFHGSQDQRESDMLILARFAGLRDCEIARAHRSWLVSGSLHVPGKGGHVEAIPAHPMVVDAFDRADNWLFPSAHPRRRQPHLTSGAVCKIGNRLLARHAPGWTMHKLRHAFITEVWDVSEDLGVAQSAGRHRSPSTTRGYAKLRNARLATAVCSLDAGRSLAL